MAFKIHQHVLFDIQIAMKQTTKFKPKSKYLINQSKKLFKKFAFEQKWLH